MDFIKKHYEKILLAAGLLILIVSAIFLAIKVSALNEEISSAPLRPKPKGKSVRSLDMSGYSNAIASLDSPPLWKERAPLFPKGEIFKVAETNIFLPTPKEPLAVLQIIRQPFKLIFRSYTGAGQNFQVDFLTGRRSFFIEKVGLPVADTFGDTGYVITKFQQKSTGFYNPSLGASNVVDVSELTIQHAGEDPIVLVVNRVAEEKEPVGVIQCVDNVRPFQVRRGQEFNCAGNTYNVVDIISKQVIIVDKLSKEKRTISLPGVGK